MNDYLGNGEWWHGEDLDTSGTDMIQDTISAVVWRESKKTLRYFCRYFRWDLIFPFY